MKVRIGCLSSGGVARVDISRIPVIAISRVLGIGVALIAKMSTLVLMAFSFSLCSTPKRCSSSIMISPRFRNFTVSESSRWVPMTRSTSPVASPAIVSFTSLALWNLDSDFTFTGNPANRSRKVSVCCLTSKVVGTSMATCLPS